MSLDTRALIDGAVCIQRCIPPGTLMAAAIHVAAKMSIAAPTPVVVATPVDLGITIAGEVYTNGTTAPVMTFIEILSYSNASSSSSIFQEGSYAPPLAASGNTNGDNKMMVFASIVPPGENTDINNYSDPFGQNSMSALAYALTLA